MGVYCRHKFRRTRRWLHEKDIRCYGRGDTESWGLDLCQRLDSQRAAMTHRCGHRSPGMSQALVAHAAGRGTRDGWSSVRKPPPLFNKPLSVKLRTGLAVASGVAIRQQIGHVADGYHQHAAQLAGLVVDVAVPEPPLEPFVRPYA